MKHPLMVCAVLDLVPRANQFTDKELHRFFYRLGSGGVDYLRIFGFWDGLKPWKKQPGGRYNLDLWNKEYWDSLERVCRIAYQWKVAIYFDLFDQCSMRGYFAKENNPWRYNENGVYSIYDDNKHSMEYYKKWIEKVVETVGLRGYRETKYGLKRRVPHPNLFGLGNELKKSGTRYELHNWANTWGYGLADYLRKLGYKKEVLWSAEQNTGHALREFISPVGWYVSNCCEAPVYGNKCIRCFRNAQRVDRGMYKFKRTETVYQKHGWIEPKDTELIDDRGRSNLTLNRKIGYSDDGVNCKDEEIRADGICVQPGKYCSAGTKSVIRLCRYIYNNVEDVKQFHHIEQLPRSVSETSQHIGDLRQHRDVNIYYRIAKQVWGKDITRRYPAWQFKRYGITE